jgi:hypothetical protein
MSTSKKSRTKTVNTKKVDPQRKVVSHRKNTTGSTREEGRQRSGNNDPQPGSH